MSFIRVRILGFLAVASGILGGSCSGMGDEPAVSEKTSVPVVFDALESDSRAAVTAESFNAPGSEMKVWGVFYNLSEDSCNDLFNGTVVTREADKWTYSPEQYWTIGYTYDFRALYPANPGDNVRISYIKGNGASSYLKVEDFTADGVDLMAASERRAVSDKDETPRPVVDLRFRHLLSRVTFVAANDDAEVYKILKFSISNVAKSGSWSGETFTATGACGEWTPGASGTYDAVIPSGEISVGSESVRLFDGDNLILAVPQTFESLVIHMEYAYASNPDNIHTVQATLSGQWESGKSYSYSFKVSPEHIEFAAPVVDEWSSQSVNNPDFDIKLP